jgi:hypothetical protein
VHGKYEAMDETMKELYSILGVSADDVVAELRYCITFILREDILDLSEEWVQRLITERFRDYTHQNAVRLNRIAVDHDDGLVFDLRLVDPNVAIQKIADDLHDALCDLLPWPPALEKNNPWHEIRIFTIGSPEAAEQDLLAYLEALRRS